MSSRSANFKIVQCTAESLTIRDIGPWDRYPTVTNDAEGVVAALFAAGQLKPGQRLFYYDSEGDLDELLVAQGRFVGFAPRPNSSELRPRP